VQRWKSDNLVDKVSRDDSIWDWYVGLNVD
jgi:hypothetical protein